MGSRKELIDFEAIFVKERGESGFVVDFIR